HYLKKKNMYDNSMIVFLSDHGEAFYEHEKWGHPHTVYNEVARVPLLVKFPGNKFKGVQIKHVVGLIDVMPTILNFYNIPFKTKEVDGRDLMELIKGGTWERPVLTSVSTGIYALDHGFRIALFKDSDKVIYRVPVPKMGKSSLPDSIASKTEEFFNLSADPGETVDLHLGRSGSGKSIGGSAGQSFFDPG
ncbi:MAG: sulfatase-like hydrolase/transferase, partial [bacterium]|nr:sulfatase-like hydrolase/transferase [bacterium]